MSSPIVPKGSLLLSLMAASLLVAAYGGNFYRDFDISWGNGRAKVLDNGQLVTLSLDRDLGSGFQSKSEYLFGKFDMQLKLVQGNSAGTVAACYLQSRGPARDEIDFEFLGNLSGEPYTVHTNVYTQGRGDREQQFHLWFDPTKHFHTYSVLWNPRHIIFAVDGIPIRDFKNLEVTGVPFPNRQPMRLHCSLWNADEWATRGGLVKTDWSQAPFVASYRNFRAEACPTPPGCGTGAAWLNQQLDATSRRRLRWVRRRHMIYDYCADAKRFAQGPPPECARAAEGAGAF